MLKALIRRWRRRPVPPRRPQRETVQEERDDASPGMVRYVVTTEDVAPHPDTGSRTRITRATVFVPEGVPVVEARRRSLAFQERAPFVSCSHLDGHSEGERFGASTTTFRDGSSTSEWTTWPAPADARPSADSPTEAQPGRV